MRAFVAFLMVGIGGGAVTVSAKEAGELMFCRFGPKSTTFAESSVADNGCTGPAKIQSVMWKCVPQVQIAKLNEEFRLTLNRVGAQECQRLCRKRGPHCRGVFAPQAKCGLSIDPEDALETGIKMGCSKECGAQAIAYCALINAGFTSKDRPLIDKAPSNCNCLYDRPSVR
ncbi:MAG: hypothetical protein AB7F66_12535 [Bacteriovoracia bacterium]